MNMTPETHIPSPREQASKIINDYARLKAVIESATAATRAQIISLTAALNEAALPHQSELETLEARAKKLALEHGAEIFGEDKRSLTENGYTLGIRETAAVEVEDEAAAIRMLQRDAKDAELMRDWRTELAMACNACLRVSIELDREYITRHYDEAPQWFAQYGIAVVDKQSASLKPAPKPRAAKAKQIKKAKELQTSEAAQEAQAA